MSNSLAPAEPGVYQNEIIFLRHDASQGKTKDRKGLIYLRTARHEGIVSLKYFKIFLFFPKRKAYPRANCGFLRLRGSFTRIVLFPCRVLKVKKNSWFTSKGTEPPFSRPED
jgi:hypothetical protein